jgi:hypothetical protein
LSWWKSILGEEAMFGASLSRALMFVGIAGMIGMSVSRPASAEVFVSVPDASLVKYQLQSSGVALRNLNDFNASALACCYNYVIDTTTQVGKDIFAAFLAAAAQGKPFIFGVPDGYAAGAVTMGGQW